MRCGVRWLGVAVSLLVVSRAFGGGPIAVTIDAAAAHQTMRGFGASGCWWHTWFDRLPAASQERALDLLYTEAGADLSIHRHNLPSASGEDVTNWKRRTVDIETAPFEYDLSRDKRNMDVLRRVVERGVEDVVLFANSPPRRLTRNGRTSGGDGGGSNLREGAEADFARYLVEVSELVLAEVGLDRARLSPINEPQWRWGEEDRRRWQEGCHYTPAETARVGRAVLEAIRGMGADAGVRLELELFDSGSWSATRRYAEAVLADEVLREHLTHIAVHSYWSDAEAKAKTRAWFDEHHPGLELAQTEFCQMQGGHDPGMVSALDLARVIHEDLTLGRVTEWTWWLGMSSSRFHDGLIHAFLPKARTTGELSVTKRLWVLAHWSRWVQRGWVRVGASAGGGVLATAFASPGGDRVVCVLVNPTERDVEVAFEIAGGDAAVVEGVWFTDADRDCEPGAIGVGPGVIPARSVCTVVFGGA